MESRDRGRQAVTGAWPVVAGRGRLVPSLLVSSLLGLAAPAVAQAPAVTADAGGSGLRPAGRAPVMLAWQGGATDDALPSIRFPGDPPADAGRDEVPPGRPEAAPALASEPAAASLPAAGSAAAGVPLASGPGCAPAAAGQTGFRIDNDLVSGQDYGYSAGLMLEATARTRTGVPGQAGDEGWLCPLWRWLGGGRQPSEQVGIRLDAAMYTPVRSGAQQLLVDDRPYAATLMLGFFGTRRQQAQWVRNELRLGWVGPALHGESVQNSLHRIINAPRFRGWDNQLRNELLLELAQYRTRRWQPAGEHSDLLGHWGLRLGTLQSSAFAGLEWRWGRGLQDDGGSAPVRPGSNEAGEANWHGSGASRWVWFVTAGARAVAWDLSLDGNVFHDSHSVRRKPVVVDGGAGLAWVEGAWTARFMWVVRSREFDGQQHLPSYGSLLVSYAY